MRPELSLFSLPRANFSELSVFLLIIILIFWRNLAPKKVPKRTELADNIRVSIANVPDIKVRIDQTKSYENDNGYSIEKDPRAREPEEVLDALSDAVDEQRAWLKETIKDESVRVKQLENVRFKAPLSTASFFFLFASLIVCIYF